MPGAASTATVTTDTGIEMDDPRRGVENEDEGEGGDEDTNRKVSSILVLPADVSEGPAADAAHQHCITTFGDQLAHFVRLLNRKCDQNEEALATTSPVVWTVQTISTRQINVELAVDVAKLLAFSTQDDQHRPTRAEFERALARLDEKAEAQETLDAFHAVCRRWHAFLVDVDHQLERTLGPSAQQQQQQQQQNQQQPGNNNAATLTTAQSAIARFVRHSRHARILLCVVHSFQSAKVNEYILTLYNKLDAFHALGCGVQLLTHGPSIGGSYLKLIGVPFRRVYDDESATAELREHRISAVASADFPHLLEEAELALFHRHSHESSPGAESGGGGNLYDSSLSDTEQPSTSSASVSFVRQGGISIVNKNGEKLYDFVAAPPALDAESSIPVDCDDWPPVDALLAEVKRLNMAAPRTQSVHSIGNGSGRVDSELSAAKNPTSGSRALDANPELPPGVVAAAPQGEDKKKCCVIL